MSYHRVTRLVDVCRLHHPQITSGTITWTAADAFVMSSLSCSPTPAWMPTAEEFAVLEVIADRCEALGHENLKPTTPGNCWRLASDSTIQDEAVEDLRRQLPKPVYIPAEISEYFTGKMQINGQTVVQWNLGGNLVPPSTLRNQVSTIYIAKADVIGVMVDFSVAADIENVGVVRAKLSKPYDFHIVLDGVQWLT